MSKFNMAGLASEIKKQFKDNPKMANRVGVGSNLSKLTDADYITMPPWWKECTGVPGLPFGKLVMIAGDSDSGKTSAAIEAMKAAQAQEVGVIYVETEGKTTEADLRNWGVDPSNILLVQSSIAEQAFELLFSTWDAFKAKYPGAPLLVVFDSIGNVVSQRDSEIDLMEQDSKPGGKGKINRLAINKMVAKRDEDNAAILIINYTYDNVGCPGKTNAGGKAVNFFSSLTFQTSRKGWYERTVSGQKIRVGADVTWKLFKNHLDRAGANKKEFTSASQRKGLTVSGPSKPIGVLISDIHFTPSTLELASAALRQARDKAWKLKVPLFIMGDTLDTKAIMRAECVNALIDILTERRGEQRVLVLIGNHDLINEKASGHSLEFLKLIKGVEVIDVPTETDGVVMIPYQTAGSTVWTEWLHQFPKGQIVLGHQGVNGANMGHYVQDKTSMSAESLKDYRVILGHYHRRQTIGTCSYVGNPYTLNFGESEDRAKGFQILHEDGTLALVATNLRAHRVYEMTVQEVNQVHQVFSQPGDLIWLKLSGTKAALDSIDKAELGAKLFGHSNFKLDKIVTDKTEKMKRVEGVEDNQLFDQIIDASGETTADKIALKDLWRGIV